MAFFLRPLFLRLLLLCVVLNLGDAPYVDEMMAEMSQGLVVATQSADSMTSSKISKEQAGKTKAKHSIYEELLALVAMPMQQPPALGLVEPDESLPGMVASLPPTSPPASIEKPPRFAAMA